jgi:tRNA modification GTPase
MLPDPADTIVALASVPGAGARAIVRLSGPRAWKVAVAVFPSLPEPPQARTFLTGELRLADITQSLPADLYFWPRPRSYTGQNVVELHTLSCLPLVELVIAACLKAGARTAQPGEFTLRAFLAGKLDLPRAEAVLGVIEARSRDELKHALAQLAGGLAQPLHELRDDLLNLLADVEAGLDFSEEDLQFVDNDQLLHRLARGLALVTLVRKQIDQRSSSGQSFRAVLVGKPNAGKSSLFNALAGRPAALVSDQPGTTRDFLRVNLHLDQFVVELIDTAGLRATNSPLEETAQSLGLDQARQGDLVLWCQESGQLTEKDFHPLLQPFDILRLATKCDLGQASPGFLATSAVTGAGLDHLREELLARAQARKHLALAPSLSRCRHHVDACLQRLRSAHSCVLNLDPPEILALELHAALEELGAMVGAIYTDDLLDRIFSRFCIGK